MPGLPQVPCLLVACFTESVAYGMAFVLFIISTMTLLSRRRTKESVNMPLLMCATLLFFFATLHMTGVFVRTYKAFIIYDDGPAKYFALITSAEKVVTQTGQVGAIILGDALSVYRTFVVWNNNFHIVIAPTMTLIATTICAVAFIKTQRDQAATNLSTSIFQKTVTDWTLAFLAMSLATTMISTALIAFKLWKSDRKLRKSGLYSTSKGMTLRVMIILVESAALYSANNLIYLALYAAHSNASSPFSGLEAPIASITFSLIILRVEKAVNRPLTRDTLSLDPSQELAKTTSPDLRVTAGSAHSESSDDVPYTSKV